MARDLGRVVVGPLFFLKGGPQVLIDLQLLQVSGHAGSVGIVGWSLGGGHGQLVPT